MDGNLVRMSRLKQKRRWRWVLVEKVVLAGHRTLYELVQKNILASGLTFWFFWVTQAVQCEMFKDLFENLLSNNFGKNEGSFDKYCSRLASFDRFDLIHVQHRVKR